MMTAEARAKAAALMGCLVKDADGLEGRVRLQKSLYLLQRKGAVELQPFAFAYHHYGPYSDALAGLLEESVRADLIVEKAENFADEWQRFEYLPGHRVAEYESLVAQESRALIDEIVRVTRGAHWRTLELAATVDFLQREGSTSREVAVAKALELKPACRDYESEASRVLDALQLN